MLSRGNEEEHGSNKAEIAHYTLQGVIHFLQTEAHRYERDRNYWEIEHAEMKTRIAKLEGECKGLDKLKDLHLKRIKMLEDSLQKERLKLRNLSSPTSSLTHSNINQLSTKTKSTQTETESYLQSFSETTEVPSHILQQPNKVIESRKFLEKCLQEITYLINSQPNISMDIPISCQPNPVQSHQVPAHNNQALTSLSSSANVELPSQSNKNNLYNENIKLSSNQSQELRNKVFNIYDKSNIGNFIENNNPSRNYLHSTISNKDKYIHSEENQKNVYHYNNDIMLSTISSTSLNKTTEIHEKDYQICKKNLEDRTIIDKSQSLLDSSSPQHMGRSIKNSDWDFDNDNTFDDFRENVQNKYTRWKTKFALKNHLASIRSVSMFKNENSGYASMATCGDDELVKLWRLPINNKKVQNQDIVPQITYRGHSGIVTSVCIATDLNKIFSAGIDSSIRCWKIPEPQRNIYAPIDDCMVSSVFMGHLNAVWDLSFQSISNILASISADGTIKLWDTNYINSSPLLSTLNFYGNDLGKSSSVVPTSVTFLNNDVRRIAVSWNNAIIKIYDIEVGKCILELKNDEIYDGTNDTQINKIICHSKQNMLISGHENKYIRFYDINSAQCTNSTLAHLDAISCLDISPDGNVLVSGGHDASVRFWDMHSPQICIQEISNHHIKAQEGVNDVSWWYGKDDSKQFEYVISVGGDGVIKVNANI